MQRWVNLSVVAVVIFSLTSFSHAQRDILRDISRALKEPRPASELLSRTPMFVVTNDEILFNLFRSYLPSVHAAEFVPLRDLPSRVDELITTDRSVVVLVDRSRGDLTIEQRYIVPYDLTLIRRQDVVIACEPVRDSKGVRYRLFISAPSYAALKQAIERFCQRLVREPRDMRVQEANPVPICVLITNAGQEIVNAFSERTNINFVWATPETIARVQDLLVTETEIYLLLPPVPPSIRERLPFNLNLLAPNQSVAVRRNKGGDYWQVLLYGSFPNALLGLIRRYADTYAVPQEPIVIAHPVVGSVKRLLVVPFGDIVYYRDRVGDFAAQVFRAVQNERFAAETVMPAKPPDPLYDWTPFQDGSVERRFIVGLAKANEADLVLTGRLSGFDTQTIRRQKLSSLPSPAADKRIWEVSTVRTEVVTARLQVWLYEGQTGEPIWSKTVTATATKETIESTRRTEAANPPALQPDQVSMFVRDERLYASAATAAVSELLTVMREEIHWLAKPGAPVVVSVAPTIVEGLIGVVEIEKDSVFVYIDIGQNQGIKVGDTFRIYREVSVKTERKTVRLEEDLGEAIVVAVYPEACKARVIFGSDAVAHWKDAALRARLVPAPKSPEALKGTEPESEGKSQKPSLPVLPAPGEAKK
ncbi:MAG: hypothetical protein ACUVTP_04520 [Candidatus Fervidibacter sp.]|uniref:hypothetical protein n=1 Tax=Candidatus Fervidibacter sp. TaxID=3100871 RepID=UPI00404967B8